MSPFSTAQPLYARFPIIFGSCFSKVTIGCNPRLATLGYKYVGQDQLIGGTWPDNEPAVSLAGGDTVILKVLMFI